MNQNTTDGNTLMPSGAEFSRLLDHGIRTGEFDTRFGFGAKAIEGVVARAGYNVKVWKDATKQIQHWRKRGHDVRLNNDHLEHLRKAQDWESIEIPEPQGQPVSSLQEGKVASASKQAPRQENQTPTPKAEPTDRQPPSSAMPTEVETEMTPEELQEAVRASVQQALADTDNGTNDQKKSVPSNRESLRTQGNKGTSKSVPSPEFELKPTKFADLFREAFPIDCIDGLLPETGYAFIGGASGDGKSFIGIDMAFAIATKDDWFGKKITRNRPVQYYYLEAPKGLKQRVLAWQRGNAMAPVHDGMGIEFYRVRIELKKHAKQIANNAPDDAVIFIDTLRAAARGVDENSSKDMGELLGAIDTILEMRPNALVILIHHVPKSQAAKSESEKAKRTALAGWSGLGGNADAVLITNREGDNRTICNAKVRDDKDGIFYSYKLQPIHVGNREDGEQVFSCYIDFQGERDGSKNEGLSPRARRVLKAMEEAIKRHGREEIAYPELKEIFWEQSPAEDSDGACTQAFKKGRQELRDLGRLKEEGYRQDAKYVLSQPK